MPSTLIPVDEYDPLPFKATATSLQAPSAPILTSPAPTSISDLHLLHHAMVKLVPLQLPEPKHLSGQRTLLPLAASSFSFSSSSLTLLLISSDLGHLLKQHQRQVPVPESSGFH